MKGIPRSAGGADLVGQRAVPSAVGHARAGAREHTTVPPIGFWKAMMAARARRLAWRSARGAGWSSQPLDAPGAADGLDLDDGSPHVLVAMGFGTTSSGGSSPNTMQEVEVDYIPTNAQDTCGSYSSGSISESEMCAARAGRDSCQVRR